MISDEVAVDIGARLEPDFLLKVDDKNVTTLVRSRLVSLTLTDNRGFTADRLEFDLDDSDGQLVLPARGATIHFSLGWKGQALSDKGRFIVDSVEHRGAPDTLTIKANSINFRGLMNIKREYSWHGTTLGEVVRQIAQRNQLSAELADGLEQIAIDHIDQTQEEDAAFLTRLATRFGAVAAIKNEKLLFIRPGSGTTVSGKPVPMLQISRQSGDKHEFTINDRNGYTGVRANWLQTDKPGQQPVSVTRKPGKAASVTPAHPQAKTAATPLAKAQQNWLEGDARNVLVLPATYPTQEAAMQAAQAKWLLLQRGVASFQITLAMGRADIFPEMPVQVSGFKSIIDEQPWLIKTLTHSLNGSGFTTKVALEIYNPELEQEMVSH